MEYAIGTFICCGQEAFKGSYYNLILARQDPQLDSRICVKLRLRYPQLTV